MSDNILLVTGGSSDIGRELISRLARKRDGPLILAHCFKGGDSLRSFQASAGGSRVVPIQADFRDPACVANMAHRILSDFGPPCRIVHLSGTSLQYERFQKLDWSRLQDDLNVQVHSIAILLQAFLPRLVRSGQTPGPKAVIARIVFLLSSVTLGLPPKHLTAYVIVKSALLGLMRSLAVEFGGQGVNINAVSPSMVETQFLRGIPQLAIESAASVHPRGRNATVEDVCGWIEFLLSEGADYVNGVNIPLTGGLTV